MGNNLKRKQPAYYRAIVYSEETQQENLEELKVIIYLFI